MANVSADIRIYPNKEMFSVDMAEIMDAAILKSGIIQGCAITLTAGSLNIADGRIVIKGRLGVVTGGAIAVPTLDTTTTCTLVAVCDLSSATPFYLALLKPADYTTLQSSADTTGTFNVSNGIAYVELGTAVVDPATGNVTSWTANANATAMKGPDVYSKLATKELLKDYMIRKAFNTGAHSAASGTGTITYTYTIPNNEIPAGYKPFDVRCGTNGGGDGWWEFYNCACDFTDFPTNKNVNLRFQRRSGTGGTLYPWIVVTFVKDIT